MSASTIKITFTANLPIGAQLGFDVVNNGGMWGFPTTYAHVFNWVNLRSSGGQVTTGTPTAVAGERAAINFVTAFNLDTGGQYIVTRTTNQVTIKAPNIYSITEFYVNGIFASYSNHPSIVFKINNGNSSLFTFDSVVFSQASNPCSDVRMTVTTSELSTQVISPISISNNTFNPFFYDIPRGQSYTLSVQNANGDKINQLIETPSVLNPSDFQLQINSSPNGATVIITNNTSYGLTFEYSLDNITWQTSNIFSGLIAGNYNLHIRDQYGCSTGIGFIVDEMGIQTPFFLISKSNSIRFANRIIWGDSENYKTDENTLSCEADVELVYKEIQQFQSADVITTQFKSNYSDISAVVIKENGDEIPLVILQKSNNIGLKDLRDARKYNLGGGKTGIYFINGNIYDYNTGIDTGEDYTLNGTLPEWAIVGNYVRLQTMWFLIENIVYDESKNAEVIVISNIYTGAEVVVQAGTIYNKFGFEVYEFTIDMFDYLNQNIRVRINNNDDSFDDLVHLSELINIKVRLKGTVEIRYKNDTNTDIFYATGIENKIRIPINKINGKIEDSSETYKTDTTALLLSAEIYELDEFTFEPVTKEMMRKITQALSHKIVKIDGVSYVKSDSIEVEGALEDTNLYIVKASMIKASSVYNSQSGEGSNQFAGNSSEIPGLIDSGDGYVIY